MSQSSNPSPFPPPLKHSPSAGSESDYEVVSLSEGMATSPFSPAAMFCCKVWTEETVQDSSRRKGSSGPRCGQVRGQRLGQTQVGHGEVPPWHGSGCVSLTLEEVWQWVCLTHSQRVAVGVSHSGGPEQSLGVSVTTSPHPTERTAYASPPNWSSHCLSTSSCLS